VAFVHPTSGRTVFHLATSVNIPLFEVELAAFAQAVGASPHKQIVLVLDRAGAGSRWLAQHPTLARARPRPLALPSPLLP
jgi:hypothetical protein